MINLLPKTEKEFLKKGLRERLTVIVSLLVAAAFLVGFIMLLPSYFLVSAYFSDTSLSNLSFGLKNDEAVRKTVNLPEEINLKLNLFQSSTNGLPVVEYFSKIIESLPIGVRLNSLSFTRDQNYNGQTGTVVLLGGISTNRDSLISFLNLLKKTNPQFIVDVPVSSLTKDKNLPFSMNIFIKNE
ncbi:MAG: hypothetical protein WC657_00175 [Candidatus Paceibacterota bacterium]|jgi:hypothetical protein